MRDLDLLVVVETEARGGAIGGPGTWDRATLVEEPARKRKPGTERDDSGRGAQLREEVVPNQEV